jgi:hypothetical protein
VLGAVVLNLSTISARLYLKHFAVDSSEPSSTKTTTEASIGMTILSFKSGLAFSPKEFSLASLSYFSVAFFSKILLILSITC